MGTATSPPTRQLAKAFGHTFTKTEGNYQVHGVVTHVIDKQGRWRANFHGLRFAPVNLVLYVNGLVNEHSPRTRHKRGLGGKSCASCFEGPTSWVRSTDDGVQSECRALR